MLIRRDDSLLLVVDLQEKLAPAIFEGERVIRNSIRLLDGAGKLGVPSFVSEQYVHGLGASVEAIRAAAGKARFFEKTHFSCAAEAGVVDLLRAAKRPQVILTGTEAHVWRIYGGEDGTVVQVVTTEMVLFEWLHQAGTDDFRALLPLIK